MPDASDDRMACDKVLGGDLGERLARHRAQVQRAADAVEHALPTMTPAPGRPDVPAVSDTTLTQVAAGASNGFVKEMLIEVGKRYKDRATT